MDTTVVATTAVGAVSALGGGLLGAWLQGRQAASAIARSLAEEAVRSRRQVYGELIVLSESIRAIGYGSMLSPEVPEPEGSADLRLQLMRATGLAQLLAPRSTWTEIAPLADAAAKYGNVSAIRDSPELHKQYGRELLEKYDLKGWATLLDRALRAMKADLGLPADKPLT
jgi:hypothetical protein